MKKLLFLPLVALATSVPSARADAVGIGAFGAPSVSTTQFNTFGTLLTSQPSPLTLGIATYTNSGGLQVYGSDAGVPFADCQGGCVTSSLTDLYNLSVTLDHAYNQFGLYVGQATAYSLSVSFFNGSNGLLGTLLAANGSSNGGLTFVGWTAPQGVEKVTVTTAVNNGYVIAAGNVYVNPAVAATPEPGSLLLVAIGAFGFVARRFRVRS